METNPNKIPGKIIKEHLVELILETFIHVLIENCAITHGKNSMN